MRRHLLVPLALVVLAARSASAAGMEIASDVAERPSAGAEHGKALTGDASPVDPGVLETELAYAPLWTAGVLGGDATSASTQAWSLTATYGLVPHLDVKIAGAFAAVHATHLDGGVAPQTGSGLGVVVAGARWRFVDAPERQLELAAVANVVVPVGSHGSATDLAISQGYWSGRLAVVATRDVGRSTMNLELACVVPIAGDAHGLVAQGQANLAVGYHLARWLQPELELNYQATLGATAHVVAVTAGLVVPWGAGQRVITAVQQTVAAWNTAPTTGAVLAYKRTL